MTHSVLWRYWLGGRKGIRSAKNEWLGGRKGIRSAKNEWLGAGIAGEVKGASNRDRPTDGLEAKPGQLYFKLER